MGKFYNIVIWLEDRESNLLTKHNFKEEVLESEIDETDRWILTDLVIKGVLYTHTVNNKKYYQGSTAYLQILSIK